MGAMRTQAQEPRSHWRLEEARTDSPLEPEREGGLNTVVLGFCSSEL